MFQGLCIGTMGPSLPDIRDRLNINYESTSNALIFESLGVMSGALIGGVLHDYYPQFTDLMISVNFLFVAGAYAAVPWSTSLELLSCLLFLAGLGKGNVDIGRFILCTMIKKTCCCLTRKTQKFNYISYTLDLPDLYDE